MTILLYFLGWLFMTCLAYVLFRATLFTSDEKVYRMLSLGKEEYHGGAIDGKTHSWLTAIFLPLTLIAYACLLIWFLITNFGKAVEWFAQVVKKDLDHDR